MATACPIDLDTLKLRREMQSIYARVATDPAGEFHFHRGPEYAVDMLGYDAKKLASLPAETTSFAGVANSHRIAPLGRTKRVESGEGDSYVLLLCVRRPSRTTV